MQINSLPSANRFQALMCAMTTAGTLTSQWSHDIFNTTTFLVSTYQQQLADFIYENHDWGSEPQYLKDMFQNDFGSNWKNTASEIISWRGLEKTNDFGIWANNNNIQYSFDNNGLITGQYANYISAIKTFGSKNCN